MRPADPQRRLLLAGAAAALLPLPALAATPACGRQTPPQTAGPYYTPDTPRRTRLVEPGMAGTPLVLTGRVLTPDCAPVAGALLDFWQCDADGHYDNRGYRLRGHQFSAAGGQYRLETIQPGSYPVRTPHIHVRVQ
jgi:protocatechuate 3,4-dioxygenase beta subunit